MIPIMKKITRNEEMAVADEKIRSAGSFLDVIAIYLFLVGLKYRGVGDMDIKNLITQDLRSFESQRGIKNSQVKFDLLPPTKVLPSSFRCPHLLLRIRQIVFFGLNKTYGAGISARPIELCMLLQTVCLPVRPDLFLQRFRQGYIYKFLRLFIAVFERPVKERDYILI